MTFFYAGNDPASPVWLLHLPSQTLAEFHIGALPGNRHLLTVKAQQPPPDEVFQSFAEAVEAMIPGGSGHLALCTRRSGTPLPHHIVLLGLDAGDVVIHYPALGFTAGIRKDGSKIPPTWRHAHIFNRSQRSLILSRAADALMKEIHRL